MKIDMRSLKLLMGGFVLCLILSCSDMYELSSSVDKYRNGDVVTIVPDLPLLVDSVVYYWDSRQIDKITTMPFVCYHTLNEETIGRHRIQYDVYYHEPKDYRVSESSNNVETREDQEFVVKVVSKIFYVEVEK